jgi:hypothetical protein
MSAKHTPGPWVAECRHVSYPGGEWPKDEFLQWEVKGPLLPWGRGDFYQSDALLIAAAPDLLAALQNLENDDGSIPDHAWSLVQAAIAKATQPPATKDTP